LRSYDLAAGWYDTLAKLYSRGAISRVKSCQSQWVQHGQRMLAVGVGSGEEVPVLLERGVALTCLEPSSNMRRRLNSRVGTPAPERLDLCADALLQHQPSAPYDVISANFFLNLYDGPALEKATRHLHRLLKPEGVLLVADFAPYAGRSCKSWLRRVYYRLPQMCFSLLGLAQWHPLFDYGQLFEAWGFRLEEKRFVPVVKGLPLGFESLCFRALPDTATQAGEPK
jgi:ubiquinone/menaquinone biosynthesis C-methylase UbiE